MSVFKQLVKEFALPLIMAVIWTVYNVYETSTGSWSVRAAVNVFGPAFFFVSWLVAQFFRVKKQQGVEKGLGAIERSIQATLAKLDKTATHLAGQITGGDSICYFYGPSTCGDKWENMLVMHFGTHPLYDVIARVCDIDASEGPMKETVHYFPDSRFEQMVTLGNLIPGHVRYSPISIALGSTTYRRFNIFFTARNGSFTQLLRCKRIAGQWIFAMQVTRGNEVVFEKIDEQFLQGAAGVMWDE